MRVFRTYIYNEKGREEEICHVLSAESETCDSLFSLENSKFHTNIAKVRVLEILQKIFSFTVEIPTVKREAEPLTKMQCSCSGCQALEPALGCSRYLL